MSEKITITLDRWLCAKGHKHTTEANAARCEEPPATPKKQRLRVPGGYIRSRTAEWMFVDRTGFYLHWSAMNRLAKTGVVRCWRPHGPNSALYVSKADWRRVLDDENNRELLGRVRAECPDCGHLATISHGTFMRHSRSVPGPEEYPGQLQEHRRWTTEVCTGVGKAIGDRRADRAA